MKRLIAIAGLAALGLGTATAAWAHPSDSDRQARREARRTCIEEARRADPDAPRRELRDDVRACLERAGFTPPGQKLRDCVKQAREASPGTPMRELRDDVRACMRAR